MQLSILQTISFDGVDPSEGTKIIFAMESRIKC
jgi:hypothetical protein